jgi:hypothetical protein
MDTQLPVEASSVLMDERYFDDDKRSATLGSLFVFRKELSVDETALGCRIREGGLNDEPVLQSETPHLDVIIN